jgi:hypothetical protein
VHFLDIFGLDLLFSHKFVSTPKPDLGHATFEVKADSQFNFVPMGYAGDAELKRLP